jgi:hypothetical protein
MCHDENLLNFDNFIKEACLLRLKKALVPEEEARYEALGSSSA